MESFGFGNKFKKVNRKPLMLTFVHAFLANHLQTAILIIFLLVVALVLSLITILQILRLERKRRLFVLKVSHELRTPLVVIKGTAPLLREKALGRLNPKQEELVDNIIKSAAKLEEVTEKLNFEAKKEFSKNLIKKG